MKSKLRPLSIGLFGILLVISGSSVPSLFGIEGLYPAGDQVPFLIALLILFLFLVAYVIWLTLLIRIDPVLERITFIYPFRLKKRTFHFSEIAGFRFRYLKGKFDYKAIQFRSQAGQKFIISDFETSNLRNFEQFCLENFDLRAGNDFRELNEIEKQEEVDKSREFDRSQAKGIRFMLFIVAGLAIVMAASLVYGMLKNDVSPTFRGYLPLIIMALVSLAVARRIGKINRQLKNTQYASNDPS